ncbi:MAG: HEAT repeat domain-containing protein, partial [Ktedonobacteraceae bacterium]
MATNTPQPTLEEILAELKDPHYKVREDAIRKIVKLYRKQAVEPVLGCLTDARSSVRMKALDALGRLRDPRSVQAVTKALNDKIVNVRAKAVRTLVALEGLNALNAIAPMLNDPKKPVRQAVLWALTKLNDPNARAALIRIMSRAKANEFETFYEVFCDKGQGQRIQLLLSMLHAPAFATSASARHAGQYIRGIASTEMKQLLAIMHDDQQPLFDRIFAIDALAAWNGSQRNHHFSMSDLPMLLDLLEHGHPQMRASLVLALDTIQDRAVQKPLLSLLHDADEEVRREALVSFQNYNRRLPSEAIDA